MAVVKLLRAAGGEGGGTECLLKIYRVFIDYNSTSGSYGINYILGELL